jgi:hypothetical protein
MGNLLFWLGIWAAQKGAESKPIERRHVGILIAVLIAVGMFFLLVSQQWSGAKGPSLASPDKSLAQMNKSPDGIRATKRYQPEGDLGEAKNKHLLLPPQSEELMELKLDDATEFVAALTGERHD